jgi:hypothetical protein
MVIVAQERMLLLRIALRFVISAPLKSRPSADVVLDCTRTEAWLETR